MKNVIRVLHATDIHFQTAPRLSQLFGKRVVGTTHLYLLGRKAHFTLESQRQLVQEVHRVQPDVVLLTGDFTAQSLPEEFELARNELDSVLNKFPTFVIPGNHDAYTHESVKSRRFEQYFGKWQHAPAAANAHSDIPVFTHEHITFFGLNPCRPTVLGSGGLYQKHELVALERHLSSEAYRKQFRILATHYPVVDNKNADYADTHRLHAVENNFRLLQLMIRGARPSLITHGHVHRGYRAFLDFRLDPLSPDRGNHNESVVEQHNPGSSGQVFNAERKRAAAFNVYSIASDLQFAVDRFVHNGQRFVQEHTPYSSGF